MRSRGGGGRGRVLSSFLHVVPFRVPFLVLTHSFTACPSCPSRLPAFPSSHTLLTYEPLWIVLRFCVLHWGCRWVSCIVGRCYSTGMHDAPMKCYDR